MFLKHKAELCRVLQNNSCACDAKLLLFSAATINDGYRCTLLPMPPLLMNGTFYTAQQLRDIVGSWPSCAHIREQLFNYDQVEVPTSLDRGKKDSCLGHIHLLHWILVGQVNPILRRVNVHNLRGVCKKFRLQRPTLSPNEVIGVTYKDEQRRPATSDRHYAYLGCPLHLLYRLLILGRMDNNWTGPLRVYEQLELALAQCTISSLSVSAYGWSHSRFGRAPRCVLICELLQGDLMHWKQQQEQYSDIIINDTSLIRVHYILIYTEYTRFIQTRPPSFNDPLRLGMVSSDAIPPLGNHFQNRFGESPKGCYVLHGFKALARWLQKRFVLLTEIVKNK